MKSGIRWSVISQKPTSVPEQLPVSQRQAPGIHLIANLKFPSGIKEACWDVELASHPRFELACPIARGMCAGAEPRRH